MARANERPDLSRLRQVDLAYLLGRTPRQIHNLVQKGMPCIVDGQERLYDAQACVAWFLEQKLREVDTSGDDEIDAQERLNLAKAKLAEHELAEREGSSLPVEWARKQVETIATRLKDGAMASAPRIAPKLMSAKTLADMQSRLTVALREMCDGLSHLGSDPSLDDEIDSKDRAA